MFLVPFRVTLQLQPVRPPDLKVVRHPPPQQAAVPCEGRGVCPLLSELLWSLRQMNPQVEWELPGV